jgi:hypothetical protein
MLPLRVNNPLAPAAYNGLSSVFTDARDELFLRSFSITLAPNQNLLNQSVPLYKDADYYWFATSIQGPNQPFAVRFRDSSGYQMNDAYISSMFFQANIGIGAPSPLFPAFWLPAGSSIVMDLLEQSGSANGPIFFLFWGMKGYK